VSSRTAQAVRDLPTAPALPRHIRRDLLMRRACRLIT